jgi:hypothetical protein
MIHLFVELLNVIFNLFINNIFQYCEIILEYFCLHVHVTRTWILVNIQSNSKTFQQHSKTYNIIICAFLYCNLKIRTLFKHIFLQINEDNRH